MGLFRDIKWRIKITVAKAKVIVRHYVRFFTVDIWNPEIEKQHLTKWWRGFIYSCKTVFLMITAFSSRKIGLQATALAYLSVLAFVPFLAIIFWIAGDLGLDMFVRNFISSTFEGTSFLAPLLNSADKIIATSQSGLFGFLSMITLFSFVFALMLNVGKVFNNAWGVKGSRPFFRELLFIIIIIVLSPLVLTIFFGGSFVYSHILDVLIPMDTPVTNTIKSFLGWVVFAAVAILIISLMYKWIPSVKVRYRYAFRSAIFAGIVFTLLQVLYLETQVMVARSSAVYGVMAAIPLFLVWMNWGWSIILFGAELSYSMQRVSHGQIREDELDEIFAARKREYKSN